MVHPLALIVWWCKANQRQTSDFERFPFLDCLKSGIDPLMDIDGRGGGCVHQPCLRVFPMKTQEQIMSHGLQVQLGAEGNMLCASHCRRLLGDPLFNGSGKARSKCSHAPLPTFQKHTHSIHDSHGSYLFLLVDELRVTQTETSPWDT